MMQNEQKFVQDLVAKGMTKVQPDAAAFRAKVKPAIDNLFKNEWKVTTWDEVLKY